MKIAIRCIGNRLVAVVGLLTTSCALAGSPHGDPGGAKLERQAPAASQGSELSHSVSAESPQAVSKSLAQVPTMSLEAIAVNGRSVGDEPTALIAAFPLDVITAEIYIRDWGPSGEALSGYQAALLPVSFSSGKKGFIEPVQYAALQKAGSPNPANSFIDDDHPRFVHSGLKTLSLADAASKGYRWVGLVLRGIPPKCAQTGRRFYAATVKFEVSADAQGTFSLELDSDPDYSGLRSAGITPTQGVKFEPLTIKILSE